MNKKRILIVSHALELGGVERSLIGLLWAMYDQKYQVDLFLLRHEGELMEMIPHYINLLPEIPAYTVLARPMVETLKERHLILTTARAIGKWKAMDFVKKHQLGQNSVALEYSHKYTYLLMPKIQADIEYDAAISFLTPHYFVAHNVKAKKKICWIHTDYRNVAVDRKSELKMWNCFDTIVSISDSARESFIGVFPSLKDRTVVIENILPENLIWCQAEEYNVRKELDGQINLLSIGRFCTPKNFDNVPEICKKIRAKGLDIKWYLIGFGPDEVLIRKKIEETGMKNYVIILGKKDNPYPYIKDCDLYVQPSRYEGKCVAVCEAQMLGKPVVITSYETSRSQLEDNVDGVIVPIDNEACAEGIAKLLRKPERMVQLSTACLNRDYSNKAQVEKIYQLIEE